MPDTAVGTQPNPQRCTPLPARRTHGITIQRRRQLTEPSQVQGAAFALQIGVDALLLGPDSDLWNTAITAREHRNDAVKQSKLRPDTDTSRGDSGPSGSDKKEFELSTGVVTRTKEGGVGDRVCVDLIQSLAEGEGMLVGSSAKMLALVHAETFETGFVPARRVTCMIYAVPGIFVL